MVPDFLFLYCSIRLSLKCVKSFNNESEKFPLSLKLTLSVTLFYLFLLYRLPFLAITLSLKTSTYGACVCIFTADFFQEIGLVKSTTKGICHNLAQTKSLRD